LGISVELALYSVNHAKYVSEEEEESSTSEPEVPATRG
jgi:hypothetical protein